MDELEEAESAEETESAEQEEKQSREHDTDFWHGYTDHGLQPEKQSRDRSLGEAKAGAVMPETDAPEEAESAEQEKQSRDRSLGEAKAGAVMPETDAPEEAERAEQEEPFYAGFVALVGKPNAGKSTLLNAYLGQKLSIVSPQPQTTRTVLRGALNLPHAQVIFIDTPGIHRPVHRLGEYMVAAATRTIEDADLVVFIVDLTAPPDEEDRLIANLLRDKARVPIVLALNKADAVRDVEAAARPYRNLLLDGKKKHLFRAAVALSALKGQGRQELLDAIVALLPESPPYYSEDYLTDQPLRVIAAEMIREQVLRFTREEVPHAVAVIVEEFKERGGNMTYIAADIYVERETQKKILLGHDGQMLKKIGQAARKDIEALVETKVYLDLWVKVRKHWRKDRGALRWLGYDITKL